MFTFSSVVIASPRRRSKKFIIAPFRVSPSLYVCLFFFMTSLCISLHNYLSLINICLFLQVTQHYRSTELHWMYALEQLLTLNAELVSINIHFLFIKIIIILFPEQRFY